MSQSLMSHPAVLLPAVSHPAVSHPAVSHPAVSHPVTASPAVPPPPVSAPVTAPAVVVLQGRDPATGHQTTWHLIPLDGELVRVERVAGHITHPAVWMQASKETFVLTVAETLDLRSRVSVATA